MLPFFYAQKIMKRITAMSMITSKEFERRALIFKRVFSVFSDIVQGFKENGKPPYAVPISKRLN